MLFMTGQQNLGLVAYAIITVVLFVMWGLIWRWHYKTKDAIKDTRVNLYRRWDDEDKTMNEMLEASEQEAMEHTKILK